MSYFLEITIVLVLIALNGLFSMSEFALVSAKKTRLRHRADEGDTKAEVALKLTDEPTPFLSTVQIGITLVGIFAGAYGGATIAEGLAVYIGEIPGLARYSYMLSITLVVLLITYLTLIFGELVPKRLALNNAETIASNVAKPMYYLSVLAKPLVIILSYSTEAVLKILKVEKFSGPPVTEEELKLMLEEGTEAGIFEKAELSMIEGVLDIGDRRVDSLMTPRIDIIAIDLTDPVQDNLKKMIESGRSIFPAYERSLDNIIGMVSVRNVLATIIEEGTADIRTSVIKPLFIPESATVLKLLEAFKETRVHMALITDEYGSIQGIVTLHDVLEAIVGDVHSLGEPVEIQITPREDGSWLVDGDTPVEKLKDILDIDSFPGEEEGYYRTIAGFIMYILQRIPKTGAHVEYKGWRYEVLDMDGNRIDKVLILQSPAKTIKNKYLEERV
jgi:putative hemolysin